MDPVLGVGNYKALLGIDGPRRSYWILLKSDFTLQPTKLANGLLETESQPLACSFVDVGFTLGPCCVLYSLASVIGNCHLFTNICNTMYFT